ncbi:Lrp/AsnC family transcriptional regulator, partial [Streptomyces albus]|uniref:Lrp/AsnC family transcriptional regulator n=1 Tax=Streptomyces albus TaxID=1888 RepID=UPI0037A377C2
MPQNDLDTLDERIVHALAEDARRTYADIGAEVGLSAPAVKRRVDRLRERGAIMGFTVRVDPAALGWQTEGFIEMYCRSRTSPGDIHRALAHYPEVAWGGPRPPAPPPPGPGVGADHQPREPRRGRGGREPRDERP